ncbi:MAG: hypothetical protein JWO18_1592 [Microbacteriaceae bacterium]|nr:hypothetical protein [Microbacteriaceae bacterium]
MIAVPRPLDGLRVIEVGDHESLAFCGKYLVELGAEVVIGTAGRGFREAAGATVTYLDSGKRRLPEQEVGNHDLAAYDIVLATSDDLESVAERPKRTIRVVVSDNGLRGPQSGWTSSDLVAQASGGLLSIMGEPDRAPLKLGGDQVDRAMGSLAFSSVMIALYERDVSGLGQDVGLSRLETVAYLEWKGRVYDQVGNPLHRGEGLGPVVIDCADGKFGLFYRGQADWNGVLSVFPDASQLRAAPFDTQEGRTRHRREFVATMSELCAHRTQQELYEGLQAAGVPVGAVYTAADLLDSPQYHVRDFLIPVPSAGANARQPAIPVMFNGRRPRTRVDA